MGEYIANPALSVQDCMHFCHFTVDSRAINACSLPVCARWAPHASTSQGAWDPSPSNEHAQQPPEGHLRHQHDRPSLWGLAGHRHHRRGAGDSGGPARQGNPGLAPPPRKHVLHAHRAHRPDRVLGLSGAGCDHRAGPADGRAGRSRIPAETVHGRDAPVAARQDPGAVATGRGVHRRSQRRQHQFQPRPSGAADQSGRARLFQGPPRPAPSRRPHQHRRAQQGQRQVDVLRQPPAGRRAGPLPGPRAGGSVGRRLHRRLRAADRDAGRRRLHLALPRRPDHAGTGTAPG